MTFEEEIKAQTIEYEGRRYFVTVDTYAQHKMVMAIKLVDAETNEEETITTNLGIFVGNNAFISKNFSFVDVNKCPYMEDLLKRTGLAEPCTRFGEPITKNSGFVEYPLYDFNKEMLIKYDATGYKEYSSLYDKSLKKAIEKMNKEWIH